MRGMGLTPPRPRRHRETTKRNPAHPVAPNELNRDFTAKRHNERWVTDITYVWTDEGWAYLAVILDLFSRAVVGWALDSTLATLHRSALEHHGITVSMSRRGQCWDNAVAESFFATLKNELIYRCRWRTRHELRNAVFEYIEVFYNRRRLHSSLDYMTPVAVEQEYFAAAA